ncbi:MAG: hypothetical protein FD174_2711 [Geobacteraceae bacterium]|nr:MAG: hypothetical protein FD174_2711 [Geobacteraceae bacterium]
MVTITCPHCRFSKDMGKDAIPAGPVRVTCPHCNRKFMYHSGEPGVGKGTVPPSPPLPSAPASGSPPPEAPVRLASPTSMNDPPRSARTLNFAFTGKASEYFGIWIVNILLTVLTLGVYSAWAKVRKRRYFYGNTLLDDAPFDYLADPMAIFRGWLIGAALFVGYSLGSRLSPILGSLFGLLFLAAMPWLIVRSRIFNARNSDHRNIRFNFRANYAEAYEIFLGLAFLVPLSLGLLIPYVVYRQKKFLVENSQYGKTPFIFEGSPKDFYLVFLKAFGGFVATVLVVALAAFLISSPFQDTLAALSKGGKMDQEPIRRAAAAVFAVTMIVMAAFYLFVAVYVNTTLTNLTWNSTRIADNRLESTLRARDMAWLYLSNAVAIALSFGLLIPWAAIRIARYRFDHFAILALDELEGFAAGAQEEISAAGEEIGDIFGIDVAL